MTIALSKRLKSILKDPLQFAAAPGHCLLCGHYGHLWTYGTPPERRRMCPRCKSAPRHRLLFLVFEELNLWTAESVLHFAPEPHLGRLLRDRVPNYLTADIRPGRADVAEDIENLSFGERSFDMVIANHILEHVADDRRALSELFRVLRPGGTAVLSVPMAPAWERTYEDPGIADPKGRERHFGQFDHLRLYGRDFAGRMAEAGFAVSAHTAPPDKVYDFGLNRNDTIFLGTRT